jgi:hypothetical protein
LRVRLIPLHVPHELTQRVQQALQMVHRAQGGLHEHLHAGRIGVALKFHALDLRETCRQPIAGIRGRVEMEEDRDLGLERAKVIGQSFGLRDELPEQGHVLRDASSGLDVIEGR